MTINQKAPVVQKREILVKASPEKVWGTLTKINMWDQWNSKISSPKLEGGLQVGSTFTWKSHGGKITSRIHMLTDQRALGWTGKTVGARAIHNWYLEYTAEGTKVMVEESMEGWLVGLIKRKMNDLLAEDMEYWLQQLKTESEKR